MGKICVSLDLLLEAALLQQFICLVQNKQTDTRCQKSSYLNQLLYTT